MPIGAGRHSRTGALAEEFGAIGPQPMIVSSVWLTANLTRVLAQCWAEGSVGRRWLRSARPTWSAPSRHGRPECAPSRSHSGPRRPDGLVGPGAFDLLLPASPTPSP